MKKPSDTTLATGNLSETVADIALELRRYGDAQRHLKNLLDSASK